jgi:putative oxidoreductase
MLDILLTITRILIGLLFIGHGARKLFGWFDGKGLEGTTQMTQQLGFRPARFWAVVSGLVELLGGLSVALGFLAPIGAALIIGDRLVAIAAAHFPKGLWNSNGGFEYPLVLIANALWIGLAAPTTYALDHFIAYSWPPSQMFVVSGVVILIGAVIALLTTVGHARAQTAQTS